MRLLCTFVPQAWMSDNAVRVDHMEGREYQWIVNLPGRDTPPKPHSYETDALREGTGAPGWVSDWDGPFEVEYEVLPTGGWVPVLDVESPAARALRAIQRYDERVMATLPHGEAVASNPMRYLLVEAETALGDVLGLECTGVVDGTNEDGSPAYYDHNGGTCPIHEWLVPSDYEGGEGHE